MAKVVFLGYLFPGHINPTLGLVGELVKRGEKVIYYTLDRFRNRIEDTGAEFRSYGHLEDPATNENTASANDKKDNIEAFMEAVTWVVLMGKQIMTGIFPEIKDEAPDYIIHDSQAFWGERMAKALKIPSVSSIPSFALTERMIDIDPAFFIENLLKMPMEGMFAKNKSMVKRLLALVSDRIAKAYQDPEFNIFDFANNTGNLNIVFTSQYLQPYSETFDDSFKFVGHSIYERKEPIDFPFERLGGSPVICIALGTVRTGCLDFYKECFKAFGSTENKVVLSVGNNIEISDLGTIPDNFIVKKYIPQLEVLKRTRLFINHGGTNSVTEGLYYDIPLILIPQGDDNHIVAKRVEDLGAGICLKHATAEALKEAAKTIFANSSYGVNSKNIGETIRTAGGYVRAADEIISFMNQINL